MGDPLACDDAIAERRYSYARAAAAEGDWTTAAEVFEQALERAPRWSAAWFALGEARERLGDASGAAAAFRTARETDPSDALGAGGRLALLGEGPMRGALSPAYVARLFDDYASRFETHLRDELHYRGPELITAALDRLDPIRRFSRCLDLGCGTGLAGAALRGRVDALIGVDLSPRMVAEARRRGIYDVLEVGDAVALLASGPAGAFDLIVAADVLVYIGDLRPAFRAVARALANDGQFAFSLESFDGEGFRLGAAMRFAHSESHVRRTARAASLRPVVLAAEWARRERGLETPGLLGVFARDPPRR